MIFKIFISYDQEVDTEDAAGDDPRMSVRLITV